MDRMCSLVGKRQILFIILGLSLLISGCRVSYLFHVGMGHFRRVNGSIPVEAALGQDLLDPRAKEHLRLVAQVKDFGETQLGLKRTQNYETVYLRPDETSIYTVSACPKDRLSRKTWWFPIVGHVPYLGFFDLTEARAESERLAATGLDVTIGVADAYSTLGWLQDPLTLNLLNGHTVGLVEIILHEMTHATLYLKGEGEFNETLAVLVGKVGAFQFLQNAYGPSHALTTQAWGSIEDERVFSSFLNSVLEELENLYRSHMGYREKMNRREEVFAAAIQQFNALKKHFATSYFSGFGNAKINNAYLLSISLYHRYFQLFEALLRRNGDSIPELLSFFEEKAGGTEAIMEAVKRWAGEGSAEMRRLEGPCLNSGGIDG